jgi:SRSO17 transposase
MSDLPRKSVEPIALWHGMPPRTLQEFLSFHSWDDEKLRDRVAELVQAKHGGEHAIGIFDETGNPKKGKQTPGVQRQWCGATGKVDNCVVTVHLGFANDDFHCLLDSELFLPESWSEDRERCKKAHIPDSMVYRPKWEIGLELFERSQKNGVYFAWTTFDEGYGSKPAFLEGLIKHNQPFIGEVPKIFSGWHIDPPVATQPYGSNRKGRRRQTPRLRADAKSTQSVEMIMQQDLADTAWTQWRIKDTTQGPFVWEEKHTSFYMKGSDDLPSVPLELIVARNVLNPKEIKYFVAFNPQNASIEEMLIVAFSRWHVERCFEDEKTELGFDHFEGRTYTGMLRHQRITAVSHLFLSEQKERLKKKSAADHRLSDPNDGSRSRGIMVTSISPNPSSTF